MQHSYKEFAERIDIDELEEAIGFEPIDNTNGNDRGYCPLPLGLHNNGDTTGKFSIHREKRVWNCWVCGGGSLITLAMNMNDMDPAQAVEWLHQFAVGEDSDKAFFRLKEKLREEPEALMMPPMPYYNEDVLDKWLAPDHPWVKERHISPEIAEEAKIGFNPQALYGTHQGEAIVLPHFFDGNLVGWQHRWMEFGPPKFPPKYTNTRDFPKHFTVYGIQWAEETTDPPLITESVPSALALISLGYPALATFGSKVTEEQTELLRGIEQGVILCPDHDTGGLNYIRLADDLVDFIPVKVATVPPDATKGDNLGDLASTPSLLSKCVKEASWHLRSTNL